MKAKEYKRIEVFIREFGFATLEEFMKKAESRGADFSEKTKLLPSSKPRGANTSLIFMERCADYSLNCKVGDIVYPSGLISNELQKSIRATGVVGWKNPDPNAPIGQRGLVICREKKNLIWSTDTNSKGITYSDDGWADTQALLGEVREKGWQLQAIEYCAAYAEDGIRAGEGFLPSIKQLHSTIANLETIENSLIKIGAIPGGVYWSSSQYDADLVWTVCNKRSFLHCKTGKGYFARCFVAI